MGPNLLFVNIPPRPLEDLEAAICDKKMLASLEHEFFMPMGILYLSSYIKQYSQIDKVGILDYLINLKRLSDYKSIDEYIRDIALQYYQKFIPDIIAVSLNFTTSHSFALICVNILRGIWPDSIIVVGGNHATNSYYELLKYSSIDLIIRGEGEKPLADLINGIATREPSNIKGVIGRDKLKLMNEVELADFIIDLDTIPYPDWELINMEAYVSSRGSKWEIGEHNNSRVACIVSSRGCPFHCTYCSSHTVHGRKLRLRSVDNIINEVKELYERYGVTLFIPWDDMWTAGRDRTIELLRKLRALNIPDFEIQYQNGLSVSFLDKDIVDEMIASGMKMSAIAIESGSPYTQKHIIRKNCNLQKSRELVSYMKSKGVYVRCFFILGFPGETKELMEETVTYAKSLNADWCVFSIASPLIGSEMYSQFIEMGCIENDPSFWGKSTYSNRSFDTPEITAEELNDFVYRANLECNFLYNPNLINGEYEKALELYRDITYKFQFHIVAWYCIMLCESAMGFNDKAQNTLEHIYYLIENNPLSKEMFEKYKDLVPLISFNQ